MARNELDKAKRLRITWVKSSIGYPKGQKATVQALGLRKLGAVVEHENTPVIRGMIEKINHLVVCEPLDD